MNSEIKFKTFQILNEQNETIAKLSLENLWADVYAMKLKVLNQEAIPKLSLAIQNLLDEAQNFNARQVLFRLVKGEASSEKIIELLPKLDFKKKSERIEFKQLVSHLPDYSPNDLPDHVAVKFSWKTAAELGWRAQDVADTLLLVAQGDPDTDPNEDPLIFIQDFLEDPVLTSGLHCIHVGFIENEIAALTVVQINPQTGWSRISYMGIMPKLRKQNLGLLVHRYSFKIMKDLGGKLYHGGTSSENIGMIRLFEKNGCARFCEMEEWNYLF